MRVGCLKLLGSVGDGKVNPGQEVLVTELLTQMALSVRTKTSKQNYWFIPDLAQSGCHRI